MVEPVAGLAAWLLCFEPLHPWETLREGLAKGKFKRFHVVSLNGREKIFTKLNKFILVFTSYSISNTPKTMELHFPHASCLSHLPSILPSIVAACFWLVVAFKIINRQPLKAMVYFIFFLFVAQFDAPNDGTVSPHALLAQSTSALTPPLPLRQLSG